MNNLKKQLQAKCTADTNQNKDQGNGGSQNLGAATVEDKNKSAKSQNSEVQSAGVKKLPYTPGVVLKFHCKGLSMTKKELRVCTIFFHSLCLPWILQLYPSIKPYKL